MKECRAVHAILGSLRTGPNHHQVSMFSMPQLRAIAGHLAESPTTEHYRPAGTDCFAALNGHGHLILSPPDET